VRFALMSACIEELTVTIVGTEMTALKTTLAERTQRTVKMVQSATPEVKVRQEQYTGEHGEQAVRHSLALVAIVLT
jgi:hypothetical protein